MSLIHLDSFDFYPNPTLGGIKPAQSTKVPEVESEIRLVLHKHRCSHREQVTTSLVMKMDAHWVELESGLAFVHWHRNLYEHFRRRRRPALEKRETA